MITPEMAKQLVDTAKKASLMSYSPYSEFAVGSALLASDGRVFTGCNIENASYSVTICAERVAFAKSLSDGVRSFDAIAVVGEKGICPPCGACLQFMSEFCDGDFSVVLEDAEGIRILSLGELLPMSFKLR